MKAGKISIALLDVEAIADEQLVRNGEPDVADRQIFDEPSIGTIQQRHHRERRGLAQRQRARQIGEEDEARLQRRNEQRLPAFVIVGDLAPELVHARPKLLAAEVDGAEPGYDASSRRYRWAKRSM